MLDRAKKLCYTNYGCQMGVNSFDKQRNIAIKRLFY